MSDLIIHPYTAHVAGYGSHTCFAKSRGQALSRTFNLLKQCSNISYRDFLGIVSCRKSAPYERFGSLITVEGRKAFYVSHNRQYVEFVYPNSDVILSSHPLDVLPIEARAGTDYYKYRQT